jgi:toxin ParE1/3/4
LAFRVELANRAERDLRRIYRDIDASSSAAARSWFDRLEATILGLDERPARGSPTPEDATLRQLLHGRRPNVYRVIYIVDDVRKVVTVLHIRHGRRDAIRV